MNIRKVAAEAARCSKSLHSEGLMGERVVVMRDGRVSLWSAGHEAVGVPGGGWKYPIFSIRYPMRAADIATGLKQRVAELKRDAEMAGA